MESRIYQGVTMDAVGEKESVAPRGGLAQTRYFGVTPDWTTFTGYFDRVKERGSATNLIAYVSYNQICLVAAGYSTERATAMQLETMKMLRRRSMDEGAWRLTSLFESGGPLSRTK